MTDFYAFPCSETDGYHNPGMMLRDWFAGQALAGYCANPHAWEAKDHRETAEMAYKIADAMLVAMERS